MAELKYFRLTPEEWLNKVGFERIAPVTLAGTETALRFFETKRSFVSESDIDGWLHGMDLSKPVQLKVQTPGTTLVGYLQLRPNVVARLKADPKGATSILKSLGSGDVEVGRFFTRPGTPLDRLGVGGQNRVYCRFALKQNIASLESVAAPVRDTWTVRAGGVTTHAGNVRRIAQLAAGGGTQFLIPEARFLYFTSGTLEVVEIGTTVSLH